MSAPFAEGSRTEAFEAQRNAVIAAIEVRLGVPTGPRGERGLPGEEGRGSQWLTGSGTPDHDLPAEDGDLYLDVLSGSVYVRVASNWLQVSNIMGPPGPPGPPAQDVTTGQRDVTADLEPASIDPANTGTCLLARTGNVVTWEFDGLLLASGTGPLSLYGGPIPQGFRSDALVVGAACRRDGTAFVQWLSIDPTALIWMSEQAVGDGGGATTTDRPAVGISGQMSYAVTGAFPTIDLPGAPR